MNVGRWVPLSGIVYVALLIASFGLLGDSTQASDSDATILSYYADSGNRNQEIAVFFMLAIAALAFLKFATHLRGRLRAVESEPHSLSTIAFGAGIASTALLMAAVSVGVGPSFTRWDSDKFNVDPDMVRLAGDTSWLMIGTSAMAAGVLIAATSLLAIKTTILPTWLGWIGLVIAIAQLVAIIFFPLVALWAWVLVVSVFLIVRHETPGAEPSGQSPPG